METSICKFLSHEDFPKIATWHSHEKIVAFPPARRFKKPVVSSPHKSRVVVQSVLISLVPPFANFVRTSLVSPILADSCQPRVIIAHDHKRVTRGGHHICLTTEVFHGSFTFAVSSRGDVKCTTSSFLAVKSYLSEMQVLPQLLHGTLCEYHLFAAYSVVRCLNWQLGCRRTVRNNVGNKKPSPWNLINVYHSCGPKQAVISST